MCENWVIFLVVLLGLLLIVLVILGLYAFNKATCGINKSYMCLVGRTALVTGGNTGIGHQVALDLASRGCRVIIAARSNLEEAKQNIMEETGNKNIVCKYLDLSSFQSVKELVNYIYAEEPRLDILINNSGVLASKGDLTEDGIHRTLQINYYGPFVLTYLLLDKLKECAPSRIIFTTSFLAYFSNISVENFRNPKSRFSNLESVIVYNNSKLAIIMSSDLFAEKLRGTGVTCNCLHPGVVRTKIFKEMKQVDPKSWPVFLIYYILNPLVGKDLWEGAQTTSYLAMSKDVENISGEFFADCRVMRKPFQVRRKLVAEEVWKMSEKLALELKTKL